ncbi:MAG: nucleoside deaminase [Chitinophagaceae bacterium]
MSQSTDLKYLKMAVELSRQGMKDGEGGPFGCVIVRDGEVVGEGCNRVTSTNDPTAHAEMVAIRQACAKLKTWQLTDCDVYASCEPCPMCLGALYWARPRRVVFANTRDQAASIAFDDAMIYEEIGTAIASRRIPFEHLPLAEAQAVFEEWKQMEGKKNY